MFLDSREIEHPLRKYRFIPAKKGPYLANPPLYSVIARLEIRGLVKTALEVRPFREELEAPEEIEPDEYS